MSAEGKAAAILERESARRAMDRTDDERAHFLVIKGRLQSHTAELERLVRDLREPGIAAETIDETVSRAAVVSRELEILKQVFEDTRRS